MRKGEVKEYPNPTASQLVNDSPELKPGPLGCGVHVLTDQITTAVAYLYVSVQLFSDASWISPAAHGLLRMCVQCCPQSEGVLYALPCTAG